MQELNTPVSDTPVSGNHAQGSNATAPFPARRKMSPALLNFWLDGALLLAVVFLVWITALTYAVFPLATSARGWELWGLSFDQWRDAQFYTTCVCALLALEHLVLHWKWVCSVLATQVLRIKKRPDEGVQVIYGVALFIGTMMIVVGSIIVGMLMVKRPPS